MTYSPDYYRKNKNANLERSRKWLSKKPLKRKLSLEKARAVYMKTPRGIYLILKGNAKRKGRDFMSIIEFTSWYNKQKKVCIYCTIPEGEKRLSIDRLDNSKGYIKGNLALACYLCNRVKGNMLTKKEMMFIGINVIKKRWKI